jgi:hypothetical protein
MKEASSSIKEKGIKTSDLKKISERGIKLPIDEPCFPIQVHAICSSEGNKEVSSPTEISYVNDLNYSTYDQRCFEHDIKRDIIENSHNIEIIHKELSSCLDSLKMTVKHYHMMNNQVEQMIYFQNKLYQKLLVEKR